MNYDGCHDERREADETDSRKIELDVQRDLLYVWFAQPDTRAAGTETFAPGVHADFDSQGKLVGVEVIEAGAALGNPVQFEVTLLES